MHVFKLPQHGLCEFYQGGLSDGYKSYVVEKEVPDETYQEDGVALFRVQGSGPDNMQAIQVDAVSLFFLSFFLFSPGSVSRRIPIEGRPVYFCHVFGSYVNNHPFFPFPLNPFHQVASSLNSSYCYILHSGSTVFTWSGGLTTSDDHELVERQLDLIKVILYVFF